MTALNELIATYGEDELYNMVEEMYHERRLAHNYYPHITLRQERELSDEVAETLNVDPFDLWLFFNDEWDG